MSEVVIEQTESTALWQGDTIVLGGSIDAVSVAVGSVGQGLKTAIVTPDAMFGTDVSMCWNNKLPAGDVSTRIFGFCNERNASLGGRVDPVIASLAFDNFLKTEGVHSFVRVMPMRPLKDKKGRLIGIEVVGKSGRQAMIANNVVDVTPGRCFSYNHLGLDKPVVQEVEWIGQITKVAGHIQEQVHVVEDLPHAVSENIELLPSVWSGECFFKLKIRTDYSKPSSVYSMAAESALLVYQSLIDKHKDFREAILVDVAPQGRRIFAWNMNEHSVFSKFKQTGIFVFPTNVIGSERILEISEIVEHLRMYQESRRKLPKSTKITGEMVAIAELSGGHEYNQREVLLSHVSATVEDSCSVVVAGAGTGGVYAAIHSAGNNVSTTVLDALSVPGGVCTLGRINAYYHGMDSEMQMQLDAIEKDIQPKQINDSLKNNKSRYHSFFKSVVFMRYIENRRVNYQTGQFVFGAVKEGKLIKSVVTASEDGYHLFPAEMFVDATGDGDIAVACGAEYTLGRETDGFPQPYSYVAFEFKNELGGRNFDAGWLDPTDTLDYSRVHLEGRALYKNKIEYSDYNHYYAMSPLLGTRESRLIKGEAVVTIQDAMEGKQWDDVVLSARANYDNHSKDMAAESSWAYRWCILADAKPYLFTVNIPLRALLTKEVDNLIMGAKTISVDHDVQQLFRMQKDLFKLGQVVSIACSLAIKGNKNLKNLDIEELHNALEKNNLIPEPAESVIGEFKHNELLKMFRHQSGDEVQVNRYGKNFIGEINKLTIYRLGCCKDMTELAMKRFLNKTEDLEIKISAAIGFVLNGCNSNVVEDALKEGFDFENTEVLYGGDFSLKYRAMLAALECSSEKYLDEIENTLYALLDKPSVLVCFIKALENITPAKAIPILRAFLVKTENEEFLMPMAGNPSQDKTSYRFILEMQAVASLQKMNCFEESRRLSKYVNSNNLLVKRYALKLQRDCSTHV
ncbi:MAG: FAD-dependent oxidoreductase [Kiritimatiellae bacterium]|jgi:hypothetical protein|nr:FAD-dependent oxidoreductase [Kiritimatiellia bacterium]